MLLKSHFTIEPSDQYLDSFWPTVSEGIDSPPNSGGSGSADEGEIVFKSNSAMQILAIPERQEPVAAPQPVEAAPPPDSHPWRWPLAFVLATVCVTGAFIYHKKTTPPPDQRALASRETVGTIAAPEEEIRQDAAMKVAMAEPIEAGAQGSSADAGASATSSTVSSSKAHRSRSKAGRSRSRAKTVTPDKVATATESPAKPAAAPKKAAPAGKRKPDELDSLINSALGPEKAKPKASADAPVVPAASDLPAQLTMNQIQTAMRKTSGHVQSCYDKYQMEGLAKVSFTILPTGKLTGAAIKGKFFGTDTGFCVAKAVGKAKFPKFSGKPMKIPNYPFRLQ